MKKLYLSLIPIFALYLFPVSISGQENDETENKDQPAIEEKTDEKATEEKKPEEIKKEEPVKKEIIKKEADKTVPKEKGKFKSFVGGEIIVRDKAIANVEDASTSTMITDKDIKNRSERTLADTLENVPGIYVSDSKKGQKFFQMRGLDHNTMAIMVDGMPFEEIYDGGGGDISRISVMNASKIIINRGVSSALYGSRGSFGSINVVTKKPLAQSADASVEVNQYGGYTINTAIAGPAGNAYYIINGSVIKENSYYVSRHLDRNARIDWYNKLVPWYNYAAGQYWNKGVLSTTKLQNYFNGLFSMSSVSSPNLTFDYLNNFDKWRHSDSIKYFANGKIGYNLTDKTEAGVSANYYIGRMNFNGFNMSPTSTINTDCTWSNPSTSSIFQQRAWSWPEDYRFNVMPYFNGEFGDFSVRSSFFVTTQSNTLLPWTSFAETSLPGKAGTATAATASRHDENTYGFYIYPSYQFAEWNRLNGFIHYRFESFTKNLKPMYNYGGIDAGPYYIARHMTAKYMTYALEDEMNFKTDAGDIKFTGGLSYDAMLLTKNDSRYSSDLFIAQLAIPTAQQASFKFERFYPLCNNIMPAKKGSMWGNNDSINPVATLIYDPIKDRLRFRTSFAKKTKFPFMHQYSDVSDAIISAATSLAKGTPSMVPPKPIKPEVTYNSNTGIELWFFDKTVSFRNDYFYSKYKTKLEKVQDPTSLLSGQANWANINGRTIHGLESIFTYTVEKIGDIVDLNTNASYVYMRSTDNADNTTVTLGKRVKETPAHQVIMGLTLDFITKTSLNFWGNSEINQIIYVQKVDPLLFYYGTGSTLNGKIWYTTSLFRQRRLHDPVMLNIKISQKLMNTFEVYVMCKNLLDDYKADPFNPGPGRMFYFGGSATF